VPSGTKKCAMALGRQERLIYSRGLKALGSCTARGGSGPCSGSVRQPCSCGAGGSYGGGNEHRTLPASPQSPPAPGLASRRALSLLSVLFAFQLPPQFLLPVTIRLMTTPCQGLAVRVGAPSSVDDLSRHIRPLPSASPAPPSLFECTSGSALSRWRLRPGRREVRSVCEGAAHCEPLPEGAPKGALARLRGVHAH
jgi:hypothetical protein